MILTRFFLQIITHHSRSELWFKGCPPFAKKVARAGRFRYQRTQNDGCDGGHYCFRSCKVGVNSMDSPQSSTRKTPDGHALRHFAYKMFRKMGCIQHTYWSNMLILGISCVLRIDDQKMVGWKIVRCNFSSSIKTFLKRKSPGVQFVGMSTWRFVTKKTHISQWIIGVQNSRSSWKTKRPKGLKVTTCPKFHCHTQNHMSHFFLSTTKMQLHRRKRRWHLKMDPGKGERTPYWRNHHFCWWSIAVKFWKGL